MIHFDPTISLGTLIALAVMLFTFHAYHIANIKRFMRIEFRVVQMWRAHKRKFDIQDEDDENGNGDE